MYHLQCTPVCQLHEPPGLSATRSQCSLVPARTKYHNHIAYLYGPPDTISKSTKRFKHTKTFKYTKPIRTNIEPCAIEPLVGYGRCGMANRKAITIWETLGSGILEFIRIDEKKPFWLVDLGTSIYYILVVMKVMVVEECWLWKKVVEECSLCKTTYLLSWKHSS